MSIMLLVEIFKMFSDLLEFFDKRVTQGWAQSRVGGL